MKCDFCLRESRLGDTFYTNPTLVATATLSNGDTWLDDGEWAACVLCAPLVRGKRWDLVLDRVIDGMVSTGVLPRSDIVMQHTARKKMAYILQSLFEAAA